MSLLYLLQQTVVDFPLGKLKLTASPSMFLYFIIEPRNLLPNIPPLLKILHDKSNT